MMTEINESYEDYLKAIYLISKKKKGGWVCNSEISDLLCIQPASVSGMLHKLKNNELIIWKPRSSIRLTPKGKNIAKETVKKAKKLREFFTAVLRIDDKDLIDKLCCGIEHHITSEVVRALDNLSTQDL
jgi:DtxR family Mn-dependent transcriptional regulator